MIRVQGIDHVAIAVGDLDVGAGPLAALFGLRPGAREHVAGQKTDVAFLHAGDGQTAIEMIAPGGSEPIQACASSWTSAARACTTSACRWTTSRARWPS